MAHPAQLLAAGGAAALAFATGVAAQPAPAQPPYVYYVVPCDSPGAIVTDPQVAPAADPGAALPPPVCVVPVSTSSTGAVRSRYSAYADPYSSGPYYDAYGYPYGSSYHARPFYGSLGFNFFGGHHDIGHGGSHFGGGHFDGGRTGGGGHFGGGGGHIGGGGHGAGGGHGGGHGH
jgi:hypothetical protein